MAKAKAKTIGRNIDAEDALCSKLTRAIALTHLLAQAANNTGVNPHAFHLGLETVFDLLTDAEDARSKVSEVLESIAWKSDEPVEDDNEPLDKKMAKQIIARVKAATKPKKTHWKTAAKQQREAAGTVSSETPSPSLGGAE